MPALQMHMPTGICICQVSKCADKYWEAFSLSLAHLTISIICQPVLHHPWVKVTFKAKMKWKCLFFTLCCIMGTALFHCNRYIAQFVGLGLRWQLLNDQQRWVFRQRADDLLWCAVPLWPGDWQCDYKWLQYFPRQLQPQGRSCSRWIPSSLPSWTGSHFVMVSVKLGLEDKTRMCRIICVHFYKAKNSNELKHLPCLGMGGLQQVNIVT